MHYSVDGDMRITEKREVMLVDAQVNDTLVNKT